MCVKIVLKVQIFTKTDFVLNNAQEDILKLKDLMLLIVIFVQWTN